MLTRNGRFVEAALKRMFQAVGRRYTCEAVAKPNWFLKSSWTSMQREAFESWLAGRVHRSLRLPVAKANLRARWFVFEYGWKVRKKRDHK
jgi:hypothetical protein